MILKSAHDHWLFLHSQRRFLERFAAKMLGAHCGLREEAADIVSEAMLAVTAAAGPTHKPAQLKAMASKKVRWLAMDRRKSKIKQRVQTYAQYGFDELPERLVESSLDVFSQVANLSEVDRLLACLTGDTREMVILTAVGYSAKEVADVFGTTICAVENRLRRARKEMKAAQPAMEM